MTTNEQDFYVGWKPEAPAAQARFNRRWLAAIGFGALLVAFLLAWYQKKAGTGHFESGQLSALTGIYFDRPVPCLKVVAGTTPDGAKVYQTIVLVGYGKRDVAESVGEPDTHAVHIKDKTFVTLKGNLLYDDGKTFLQVDGMDNPERQRAAGPAIHAPVPEITSLGEMVLTGEIVDPKCFFGVMKPGEGKVHQDCATRCILGGITPVFVTKTGNNVATYYLLATEHGGKANQRVQHFVGQPVRLRARLERYDDWIIAYLPDDDSSLRRLTYLQATFGENLPGCSPGHPAAVAAK